MTARAGSCRFSQGPIGIGHIGYRTLDIGPFGMILSQNVFVDHLALSCNIYFYHPYILRECEWCNKVLLYTL